MQEEETDLWQFGFFLFMFVILVTGDMVRGDSLATDREVLLNMKSFLQLQNPVNQGPYSQWGMESSDPCQWSGISCTPDRSRVNGINFASSNIAGELYNNLSSLTALSHLDFSRNTIHGPIPDDLSKCQSLVYLNLSHNLIEGKLRLAGLSNLEVLDLATNRIAGEIRFSFPAICNKLLVANISGNNFTGRIDDSFDSCMNLQYLDLSANFFNGRVWNGVSRLKEFSISENYLSGEVQGTIFSPNCSLEVLDLSENNLTGMFPGNISNCRNLVKLNLWGNKFNGQIPSEIGSIFGLEILLLGNNSFLPEIPETLLNLRNLAFLDLSRNNFGGNIQVIFGRFTQLKFLLLHSNSYTGGLYTSGILKLTGLLRLDLSCNNFMGPLPVEISQMPSLKLLILAYNQFKGPIPEEFGSMKGLQALDLSFNNLTGRIPSSFGNMTSLLWLMLANNSLIGEIPRELGNCSSLLWLNLANNELSGEIPPEMVNMGSNPTPTFQENHLARVTAGSGECLTMKRWIPADYPPFSFVYTILTEKSCRNLWDKLLKGIGIFPVCGPGTRVRTYQISGYLQLSGNQLSGQVPENIGNLRNFSMLHLGLNQFTGRLPPQVAQMSLVVLNLTKNMFSGEIPEDIADLKCLVNLDLSYNNFSGVFPAVLNNLTDLNKFNVSYNPLISGTIPSTGQLATFEKESYLGDPLLILPSFISNETNHPTRVTGVEEKNKNNKKWAAFFVFLTLILAFAILGVLSLIVCVVMKTLPPPSLEHSQGYLLQDSKVSSSGSSPWYSLETVKVIRLDQTAFTHGDILKATNNFSESKIIGKGGYGTVYKGLLPDGRVVAVKKLLREGAEAEKEFKSEMEILNGPHPNLVTLYGWCLDGSEKILVYEYMEGGSLEDQISDRTKLTWRKRIDIAIDVARALVFLHHECYPAIVHRDVKASNVLLDKEGKARVTDFGLARSVDVNESHVSTVVAGTIGYVAPEYGQTWQATTKGDVYSFGVLAMELATGRRAVDGGEECLVEWARRIMYKGRNGSVPVALLGSGLVNGAHEMCELLQIGVRCTAESPQARPNMKEVLAMLINIQSSNNNNKHNQRNSNGYTFT